MMGLTAIASRSAAAINAASDHADHLASRVSTSMITFESTRSHRRGGASSFAGGRA